MANFFDDLKDHFKERVTNPFVFSFLLSWFFRNWDLLFTLFNFDPNLTREKKIELINTYIGKAGLTDMILNPLWMAFVGILSYYLLSNVGRFIAMASREWITPTLDRWVGKHLVAPRERVEKLQKRVVELTERSRDLEKENLELIEAEEKLNNSHIQAEEVIVERNKQIDEHRKEYEKSIEQNKNLNQHNISLSNELNMLKALPTPEEFFNNFFEGVWKTIYRDKGVDTGRDINVIETFKIEKLKYYVNNDPNPKFSIRSINYNSVSKILTFVKVGISNNVILYNELEIVSDTHLIGVENQNVSVEYKRVFMTQVIEN